MEEKLKDDSEKFNLDAATSVINNVDEATKDLQKDIKNLLVEVPIEQIASNSYSLNYAEYVKDETEEQHTEGIEIKTIGEICNIHYGTRIVKKDNISLLRNKRKLEL